MKPPKKKKKPTFWSTLRKRLFERNREHVGIKTSFNLYRLHPILRLFSKGIFLQDENPDFSEWVEELKRKNYRKALILGNAPCLNDLSPELFKKLSEAGYLTIGLNRSIYAHQTDILIWSDLLTIDEILKKRAIRRNDTVVLHVRLERNHQVLASKDPAFQSLHRYWSKHRNFRNWPKTKLFMFRNCAIGSLHLCFKLKIEHILMVGFGFDNREYFYKTKKYQDKDSYEIISEEQLKKNCGGYDTQKIIKEVIEYLTTDEGISISYNGNSEFLANVANLKRVELAKLEDQLSSELRGGVCMDVHEVR